MERFYFFLHLFFCQEPGWEARFGPGICSRRMELSPELGLGLGELGRAGRVL